MPRSRLLLIVLSAAFVAGCGSGDTVWVKGVLQKGGETYKPPEGRKVALYFYPIQDGATATTGAEMELANYDAKDGSFTVPGREGNGIPPGKYRIAVVETLRREERDKLNEVSKQQRGRGQTREHEQTRITNDTNFLEAQFGEKTSPFIRDLRSSTNLTLDMAKPAE